ncbi:MAG: helix-turn-helix transcriptional regulator [Sphaerochaetaceae bacterium]|nr:helix-turn-helix transcriptional regulator [Spirochaetales bacterium]MDY5498896.1 helix-turn-helix transcriptional regulator [Sphaerochaetaceae bacterium]
MRVVEKAHHIDVSIFGEGADVIADILRKNIPGIKITPAPSADDDEQYEEIKDSDWYKRIKGLTRPGDVLRIRRENADMTQAQLSEKSGVAIPNISLMEAGKRPIGPRVAKKLAGAFDINYKKLL